MWRMIWDVLRFNACAARLVTDGPVESNLSIGDYLEREGYSDAFRDDYLIVHPPFPLLLSPTNHSIEANDSRNMEYPTR